MPSRLRVSLGLVLIAIVVATAGPSADRQIATAPQAAGSPDVVAAFLNRREPRVESYRARRRLEASNERYSKDGWLEVMTELGTGGFTYQVLGQGGSDYVRRKVLLPALEAERELAKSPGGGAFDVTNYRLTADGFDGEFPRIRVTPLRKDKLLVDGWLLVSPRGTELVAVKGQMSKTPSFWTTRVDVVRRYERIAGVRVPVELESVANVRIAGRSTFKMRYSYEAINGTTIAQ